MNVGGHVFADSKTGPLGDLRGSGTDGGVVVDFIAAKNKHSAGPTFSGGDHDLSRSGRSAHSPAIIMSASADSRVSSSSSLSALACAKAFFKNRWKASVTYRASAEKTTKFGRI